MSKRAKTSKKPAPKTQNRLLPILIGVALIAVVAVVAILLGQSSPAQAGQTNTNQAAAQYPAEVSVTKAAEKRAAGAFILDVRQPEEWVEGHIPGATLIPLDELQSRVNELPKDQEIVVVCRSGNRSAEGRDILRAAGFQQVTSMAGGMNQWQSAGYEVVTGP